MTVLVSVEDAGNEDFIERQRLIADRPAARRSGEPGEHSAELLGQKSEIRWYAIGARERARIQG